VLDDFPEEPRDSDLPPPPAWAVEKPKSAKSKKSADGPLGALQAMPLPALIFVGGSAALWFFLLAVVVPSMGGQANAPNAQPANAAAAPGGNAQANAQPAAGQPANAPAGRGFALLPPVPFPTLYPAGGLPPQVQAAPIRADVVTQHENALRSVIGIINEMTAILREVRDGPSARQCGPRLQAAAQRANPIMTQAQTLPRMTPAEEQELARRLTGELKKATDGMQAEANRLMAIPGMGPAAAQLTRGSTMMSAGLQQALAGAGGSGAGTPQPYVEVAIHSSNSDIGEFLADELKTFTDGPAGFQRVWDGQTTTTALRIWPVAVPQAFADRAFGGKGTYNVNGHRIEVTAYKPDPAKLDAFTTRHTAEKAAQAAANAPDPTIAPGTPPVDAALIKVKSGKNHMIHDGCKQLATVLPEDARKDEVVKALTPILSDPDIWTAKEAAKALGNWRNDDAERVLGHTLLSTSDGGLREETSRALLQYDTPGSLEVLGRFMIETTDGFKSKDVLNGLIKKGTPEVVPYLIQYVEKSNDLFGRADAIRALGRMKAAEAVPAMISRLKENWSEVPDALRAVGPAAEPALIALLKDPDHDRRKTACQVLRDIGGQDTLDAMKKLPSDSDPVVRDEAAKTMQAIAARVKNQKRDDSPAKENDNSFGKRSAKSRG
jgi:HEAT repeat protein